MHLKKHDHAQCAYVMVLWMAITSALVGCVQSESVTHYHSQSTLNYRGEEVTHTRDDHWVQSGYDPVELHAMVNARGDGTIIMHAERPPPPVHVFVLPAVSNCAERTVVVNGKRETAMVCP